MYWCIPFLVETIFTDSPVFIQQPGNCAWPGVSGRICLTAKHHYGLTIIDTGIQMVPNDYLYRIIQTYQFTESHPIILTHLQKFGHSIYDLNGKLFMVRVTVCQKNRFIMLSFAKKL